MIKTNLSKKHRQLFNEIFHAQSIGTWNLGEIFVLTKSEARKLFELGIKIGRKEVSK